MFELNKEEKKVEYLELIYDLVFVYMVGRNNALLSHFENGFVSANAFIAYILCTLAIIQIWNFTTYYINMFGRNGIRDHVFLLINMYLMYFIGESTRFDWSAYQAQYHIAWALILVNIGAQYVIELRNHEMDVWNRDFIKRMAVTLFAEAAIALSIVYTAAARSSAFVCSNICRSHTHRNEQKQESGRSRRLYASHRARHALCRIHIWRDDNRSFRIFHR